MPESTRLRGQNLPMQRGYGMNIYSYDRRYAGIKRIDLAWIEKLRKDFLTLLKNLPRVHDYKSAHILKNAVRVYRQNFDELFFECFLNELKNSEEFSADADWINHKLRSIAWSFSIELSVPIDYIGEYHSEEALYARFQKEFPKWKARVQRKASAFWNAMKEVLDWYTQVRGKPGIDVKVPTIENTVLEGFQLEMRGYESENSHHEKELHILKEGLRLYRKRAAAVAPILIKRQLPVTIEFKVALDKGGEYNHRTITLYASSMSKGPAWVAHMMAHEMGHHLFRTYLGKTAQTFWYDTIRGDFGEIDLQELLNKWPGDAWAFNFPEAIGASDPILALQVDALSHDAGYARGPQTKEDFQRILDGGQKTLTVPKTPITGYANKNPEEAFCEAIGLLVAYGIAALHERVRLWLSIMMPGDIRVARLQTRASRTALPK